MAKAKTADNRLKEKYLSEVVPALVKEFGYKNINEVPKLEKIVLNMGLGDVKDNSKSFNLAVEELAVIAGQKPVVTTAKKSIANFKVRQNMKIGAKATLRGKRMYEFMDKFTPPYAIRISTKNFGFENSIKSVPLYAVFCIK